MIDSSSLAPSSPSTTSMRGPRPGSLFALVLAAALALGAAGCDLESFDIPTDPKELDQEVIRAAQHGTAGRLEALIEAGGDAAQRDMLGWTPLHYAVNRFRVEGNGDFDVVKVLLETPGVDIHSRTNDGFSPIVLAAEHGNIELLELLLEHGADLKFRDDDGFTVLSAALRKRRLEMARHLLAKGVDVNEKLPGGGNALFVAIRSRSPEAVQMLIDAGADLHGGGKVAAPIIFASAIRNQEVVQVLLDAGADVNAINPNNGLTALHRAVGSGPELVRLLLDAGAKTGVKNHEGFTALDLAREHGNQETIELLTAAQSG